MKKKTLDDKQGVEVLKHRVDFCPFYQLNPDQEKIYNSFNVTGDLVNCLNILLRIKMVIFFCLSV